MGYNKISASLMAISGVGAIALLGIQLDHLPDVQIPTRQMCAEIVRIESCSKVPFDISSFALIALVSVPAWAIATLMVKTSREPKHKPFMRVGRHGINRNQFEMHIIDEKQKIADKYRK